MQGFHYGSHYITMYKQPTIREEIEEKLIVKIKHAFQDKYKGTVYATLRRELIEELNKMLYRKPVK